MDSFAANRKKSFHVRSNSLPSKPHPIVEEVDEHLCRLRASEATSSSSSLCHKLDDLKNLHECIDKLLLLPLTHQALVDDKKSVEALLEGSLKLLDLCATVKDALLQTKEIAHDLESTLRRRRGDDIVGEVQKYLNSRKMIKKAIHKALKGIERSSSQKCDESSEIVSMLKEAEAVTCNIIESLLSFTAGSKLPSKMSKWSLVSKLIQPKKVASKDEDTNLNEVEMVDAALYSITSHKSDFLAQVEDVQISLKKLEPSIHDLEEDLESLYRRLIMNRVSLLNILTH